VYFSVRQRCVIPDAVKTKAPPQYSNLAMKLCIYVLGPTTAKTSYRDTLLYVFS
jgi:hypothetical protein